MKFDINWRNIKKTLIIKDTIHGRATKVNALSTSQTKSGKWIAEEDRTEFYDACSDLCKGIKDCSCEDLHEEADQDDDGKEYTILTG